MLFPSKHNKSAPTDEFDETERLRQLFTKAYLNLPLSGKNDSPSFTRAVLLLVGHMVGTAALCACLFFVAWCLGLFLQSLHSIHPLPSAVLRAAEYIEVFALYFDGVLCLVLLIAGAWRFVKEIS
jgi:hypothetical protein